ncbi:high-potential iron-sulfur protein [Dyella flagellata]|uniref:High-potential iron-sulfur protein n=1 Tax=Dyella flagellata TaxID=1867833 RepID=A0ABQ5XEB0_9GAMM|nr:high-potential iron-sulfur protein [Dyella flagellata]GLQ89999.1 high-potential iron-sulfur protein [Dyella flagellata]
MPDASQNNFSRRRFLKMATGTTAAAFVLGSMPRLAEAFGLQHLDLTDPTAKAMNYVEDASKSSNALHKPGSACANCRFYAGDATGYGPCQLYPGKAVNSKGWCASYTPKNAQA